MEEERGGRRRRTLLEQMSGDLSGLTLDDILNSGPEKPPSQQQPPPQQPINRTLLDVIRDEEPNGSLFGLKDKKSWKAFRNRLWLKRAGAAWQSAVPIPASDIIHIQTPLNNGNNSNNNADAASYLSSRSLMSRINSVRYTTLSPGSPADHSPLADDTGDDRAPVRSASASGSVRPFMVRRISARFGPSPLTDENIHAVGDELPARSFRPQLSRHNSIEGDDGSGSSRQLGVVLAEERALSAREAVAAQEAAEAEVAAQAAAERAQVEGHTAEAQPQPVRMSLMDLLEETDRQMGLVGSRYTVGDEEDDEEEEGDVEDENDGVDGGDGIEHTCCVCMVRHKGAAFIPCGHTFCRFCSRELWVQRGNCPLCNGFIVEILDIF